MTRLLEEFVSLLKFVTSVVMVPLCEFMRMRNNQLHEEEKKCHFEIHLVVESLGWDVCLFIPVSKMQNNPLDHVFAF